MNCPKCKSDRFYTVANIDGRERLAVKCMNKACGYVERAPDKLIYERASCGRLR